MTLDLTRLRVLLHGVETSSWGPSLWFARGRLSREVERHGDELLSAADIGIRRQASMAKDHAKRKVQRAEAAKARRLERLFDRYENNRPITRAEYDEVRAILAQRREQRAAALTELARLDAELLDCETVERAGALT